MTPASDEPLHPGELPPAVLKDPRFQALQNSYWRKNLWFMAVLMVIWAAAGLGCGVLWADHLNEYQLFGSGLPLGFWFAQQGSIIVFVFLILIYCIGMNLLDRQHHKDLVKIAEEPR